MAFAMRMMTSQVTVQIALFTLALYVFGELVFVKRIVETLVNTPLGHMPTYVANAFMNAEMLTLITIGVMVFVGLSLPMHLRAQLGDRHARLA